MTSSSFGNSVQAVPRITAICAMMTRPNAKSKDIHSMSRVKPNSITKCCNKTRSTNCVVLWTHLKKLSSIKPAKSYDVSKNILFTLNRRKRTISWSTTNAFFDLVPPSRTLTNTDSPRRIRSQTIVVVSLWCYAMTNWLKFYWISMRRIEILASSRRQSCGGACAGHPLLCVWTE